jgi:hypothetical protein
MNKQNKHTYELEVNPWAYKNLGGNGGDERCVWWVCPKCNYRNQITDAYEYMDYGGINIDVACEECWQEYNLVVNGRQCWEIDEMKLIENIGEGNDSKQGE